MGHRCRCFLLLLCVAVPLARCQSNPVTYSTVAKRLELLLPELSEKVGLKLVALAPVSDEVLILQVKDAPLNELMEKIADVASAKWEKTRDGFRLVRTAAMERQQREAELRARATQIKAALDKTREALPKGPFDDDAAKKLAADMHVFDLREDQPGDGPDRIEKGRNLWQAANRAPTGRAMIRLLALVDPRAIAEPPGYTCTVYSTKPNRFQRPFAGQTDAILGDLVSEQHRWIDAVHANPGTGDMWMGGDPRHQTEPAKRPDKIILTIGCYSRQTEFEVTLVALDSDGRTILGASGRIQPGWWEARSKSNRDLEGSKQQDFAISPENLEFLRLMSPAVAQYPHPIATRQWLDKLSRPEVIDPLSFAASESLMEMARRKGVQLVAAPTDSLITLNYGAALAGKVDLNAIEKQAAALYELDVAVKNGWMAVKPMNPVASRTARAPRRPLGQFVRTALSIGYPSLAAIGEFALAADQESMWPTLFGYCSAVLPRSERLFQFTNWNACRLYGSLSPQQRSALDSGATLPGAMLSVTTRSILQHMLLYDTSDSMHSLHAAGERGRAVMREGAPAPTEVLRDLQPGAIRLQWTVKDNAAALVGTKGNGQMTPWTLVESPERIGAMLSRSPTLAEADFWMGRKRELAISILPIADVVLESSLEEAIFDLRSPAMTMGQLPADFRQRIDQAARDAAKNQPRTNRQPPPPRR